MTNSKLRRWNHWSLNWKEMLTVGSHLLVWPVAPLKCGEHEWGTQFYLILINWNLSRHISYYIRQCSSRGYQNTLKIHCFWRWYLQTKRKELEKLLSVTASLERKRLLIFLLKKSKTNNTKQTRKSKAASDKTYHYLCYGYCHIINISTRNQPMKNLESIYRLKFQGFCVPLLKSYVPKICFKC